MVTRPEPPAADPRSARRFSGDLGLPAHSAPIPAGLIDELRRALRVPGAIVRSHPHFFSLLLIALLGLVVGSCVGSLLASNSPNY